MAIATVAELSMYLQQTVDSPTATFLLDLTEGLIVERIGAVSSPAPAAVKALTLEVAGRAYVNPSRNSMETIDDYTWRKDPPAAWGVYLLEDEVRRLRPGSSRVRSQVLSAYGDIPA